MTTDVLELIAAHPFLSGLDRAWLQQLADFAAPVVCDAGERLFAENEPAQHFWLLRSGLVALDLHVPGRGDIVIETIGAGEVVGWSWLYPPYRWHVGAVAVQPTDAVRFDATGVRQLIGADPAHGLELTSRFMVMAVDRLQTARIRLLDLYGIAERNTP